MAEKDRWLRLFTIARLGRWGCWQEALEHLLSLWRTGGLYHRRQEAWEALYVVGKAPSRLPLCLPTPGKALPLRTQIPKRSWWLVGIPPESTSPLYALLCPMRLTVGQALFWADLCTLWLTFSPKGWSKLLDKFSIPLVVTDLQGHLIAWNAAAQTQWGIPLEAGQALWALAHSPRDGEILQELVRLGTSGGVVTLRSATAPKTYRVFVTTLLSGHQVWQFHPIQRDDLQWQNLARSFQVATLGELASGIAHEINNPLQVILGNAEMALDEGAMDNGTREKLSDILSAASRIREITRTIIHFADARRTRERELVDVNMVVNEAVRLARYALSKDKVQVATDCAPQGLLILGQRGDLEEAILQLVRNAGEAILAAGKGSQVIVRTRQRNGWARIEVEDDGPGVPEEWRERIFAPFVTTKAEQGGTGLGLAIVQNIVAAHQGRIWVESAPSGGALFVVELPLWRPEEEPAAVKGGGAGDVP
ncbi:MAG: hypothetical protein LKKZDAJK_000988 [Candidatus Fervidibacter sp.]